MAHCADWKDYTDSMPERKWAQPILCPGKVTLGVGRALLDEAGFNAIAPRFWLRTTKNPRDVRERMESTMRNSPGP